MVQTREVEPGMRIVTDPRFLHWSASGYGPFPPRGGRRWWRRVVRKARAVVTLVAMCF